MVRAAAAKPASTAGRAFAIGSDVELGRALLRELFAGPPRELHEQLVYDRGALWLYQPDAGIFAAVAEDELHRKVQAFDGAATPRGQLVLSSRRITGAIACAAAQVTRRGFFDERSEEMGIAFKNGYVTISSKGAHLVDHSPKQRATVALPFDYNGPPKKETEWERFLESVFRDDRDADQKRRLLAQFAGACLMGRASHYQRAIVLLGIGANGKSVFLQVVRSLFPAAAVTSVPPQDFQDEYRRAMLASSLLNAVTEIPENDILEASAFKAVIAGDEVTCRWPRERPFQTRMRAGHVFAANSMPMTSDQTLGFWRRFVVVAFNRSFAPAEQDVDLADRMCRPAQLAHVAAWAIEGAIDLLRTGRYAEPASSGDALQSWRRGSDQVRLFVEEAVNVVERPSTSGSKLYDEYVTWAKKNGHSPVNSNKFAARLTLTGLGIVRTRERDGNFWNVEVR